MKRRRKMKRISTTTIATRGLKNQHNVIILRSHKLLLNKKVNFIFLMKSK